VVLPQVTPDRVHKWGSYVGQVWTPDGRLEAVSMPGVEAPKMAPGFHDLTLAGHDWRVYATAPAANQAHQVQVLQSGEFRRHLAVERAGAALAPVLILLPLAILILWGVAATLSREVQAIGRQAAQQDENSIRELPLTRVPAEIVPLVASFNSLLARLRDAFNTQRRFVQDAAHELRTPITAVALQLENVRRDLPPGACQESFAQLLHLLVHEGRHHAVVGPVGEARRSGAHQQEQRHQPEQKGPPQRAHRACGEDVHHSAPLDATGTGWPAAMRQPRPRTLRMTSAPSLRRMPWIRTSTALLLTSSPQP
jgi:hypothetical protein